MVYLFFLIFFFLLFPGKQFAFVLCTCYLAMKQKGESSQFMLSILATIKNFAPTQINYS